MNHPHVHLVRRGLSTCSECVPATEEVCSLISRSISLNVSKPTDSSLNGQSCTPLFRHWRHPCTGLKSPHAEPPEARDYPSQESRRYSDNESPSQQQ